MRCLQIVATQYCPRCRRDHDVYGFVVVGSYVIRST
jgi:hypothetical protein